MNCRTVLWRCWLGGKKGVRPVKTEWWGAGVVICLERGADLHMAQLVPCHSLSLASVKSRRFFTFLVPAHPGGPKQRAVKRVCLLFLHYLNCYIDGQCNIGKLTHTHTHPFNGPFSGTTRVSRYHKGKTNLDFSEARDSEWQWHQLDGPYANLHIAPYRQPHQHPITQFLQAGCLSRRPNNSVEALKALREAHSVQIYRSS